MVCKSDPTAMVAAVLPFLILPKSILVACPKSQQFVPRLILRGSVAEIEPIRESDVLFGGVSLASGKCFPGNCRFGSVYNFIKEVKNLKDADDPTYFGYPLCLGL